jgi:hypothetical protein
MKGWISQEYFILNGRIHNGFPILDKVGKIEVVLSGRIHNGFPIPPRHDPLPDGEEGYSISVTLSFWGEG